MFVCHTKIYKTIVFNMQRVISSELECTLDWRIPPYPLGQKSLPPLQTSDAGNLIFHINVSFTFF